MYGPIIPTKFHIMRAKQNYIPNLPQLFQLTDFPVKWPTDSRKDEYYINEEGMYELTFTSQQKENFIFVMIMKMIFGNYISKK